MKLLRIQTETGDFFLLAHEEIGDKEKVKTEQNEFEVDYLGKGTREGEHLFKVNGEVYRVTLDRGFMIINGSEIFKPDRVSELPTKGESFEDVVKGKQGEVLSPLFGRVVQVRVKEGESINKGHPLLSIEAMKSETVISAPIGGIVEKVMVKPGQGVKRGEILVIIRGQ